MPNLIQIKRSDATAAPTSLANGELAFSGASNVLFIGIKNSVVPIAGGRSPGTLVANQAIVVDSSSLIDTIRVGNTSANAITNTSGIFLANSSSNTRLTIPTTTQYNGGDYWLNANGSWLQIPAAVTTLNGLSDVTISSVGNNNLLMYDSVTSQWINKSSGNGFVANSTSLSVLAGNSQIVSNSTGVWLSSISAAQITGDVVLGTQTSGSYVATITAGAGLTGDGTGEGSTPTLAVGAGNGISVAADAVSVTAGNGIFVTAQGVNVLAGNNQLISNSSGVWVDQSKINHDALTNYDANKHIDHTAVSITAGAGLTGGGNISASRTIDVGAGNGISVAADAISVLAGNNQLISNSSGVWVDQSKIDHNSLINYDANRHIDHTAVSITAGNGLTGGGTIAASRTVSVVAGNNQIVSNSTGVWLSSISAAQISGDIALGTQTSGSYVATITAGAGLTGDGTGEGSTPTLAVGTANGITVAADAISVKAGNAIFTTTDGVNVLAGTGVVVNATGVHIGQAVGTTSSVTFQDLTVNGNTALGSDTADRVSINGYVNTAIIPEANNTRDLGTSALRWNNIYGKDITANNISVAADVTVSGNLIVSGDLVTLNVSTLTVEDPLVELARLNPADSLDIGFFGLYVSAGNKYSGLFRDASDSGKYKLFSGLATAPTTTVDTSGAGYTQATLISYLETGALITNATHVAITANSTVNVTVTANTLTLSNPLVGTSGGTGLNSFTTEDILVANTTNGFRKLSKGEDGTVLQISGTSLVYSTLDGGTF